MGHNRMQATIQGIRIPVGRLATFPLVALLAAAASSAGPPGGGAGREAEVAAGCEAEGGSLGVRRGCGWDGAARESEMPHRVAGGPRIRSLEEGMLQLRCGNRVPG